MSNKNSTIDVYDNHLSTPSCNHEDVISFLSMSHVYLLNKNEVLLNTASAVETALIQIEQGKVTEGVRLLKQQADALLLLAIQMKEFELMTVSERLYGQIKLYES
ncbi:hypothetical protein J2Z69_000100 [Paenibacillus shirakamiensis]|uniref:Uncharacterized protein n=1 Tax=Paenibacillus shirakamiensis TaxID=1265935 RepID=A0ABS4JD94_9BACL|nr:hypothetical protein [Paenibacillus shirakamiensis]MBP1999081.1 hypothetical protein [Paenibacillus shirakamiensis]